MACVAHLPRRESMAPVAQGLDECRGPIAQPTIELRRFFELLPTPAGHGHEAAGKFRKAGHVAPEFFKLRHGQDIFLTFPPAFFDVLQRDVGGHAGGQRAHGVVHLFPVHTLLAGQPEQGAELVDIDPLGRTVVPGEE